MRAAWVGAAVMAIIVAQLASVAQRWAERPSPGPSKEEAVAMAWLDTNLPPGEVIAAVGDGQRVGYYTRRPTVAIPSSKFTARPWNLITLRTAVRQYGVRAVVVTGEEGTALLAHEIPGWLLPAYETSGVRIFRVAPESVPSRNDSGAR